MKKVFLLLVCFLVLVSTPAVLAGDGGAHHQPSIVVRKYYMNGIDVQARKDIESLRAQKVGREEFEALASAHHALEGRVRTTEVADARQDASVSWLQWLAGIAFLGLGVLAVVGFVSSRGTAPVVYYHQPPPPQPPAYPAQFHVPVVVPAPPPPQLQWVVPAQPAQQPPQATP